MRAGWGGVAGACAAGGGSAPRTRTAYALVMLACSPHWPWGGGMPTAHEGLLASHGRTCFSKSSLRRFSRSMYLITSSKKHAVLARSACGTILRSRSSLQHKHRKGHMTCPARSAWAALQEEAEVPRGPGIPLQTGRDMHAERGIRRVGNGSATRQGLRQTQQYRGSIANQIKAPPLRTRRSLMRMRLRCSAA